MQAIEVTYKNNNMYVNGEPYYMKGICYHPVPKGKIKRDFSTLDEDINLMKEAGINTIRVYEPIDDINVLNKLNEAGIKVIINFGYNQRGRYDILSGTLIDYIFKYQDHDAILM
jgi:aryl-phospho-beta-D-glucosidase BglC (GH1 family)